jgi:hypothetical protein
MQGAVTKAEFASLVGVSRGRVSQWLRAGKIDGAAIIGEGRDARIDAELAKRQLDARLDLGQRLGANGKALLAGSLLPIDADIKAARLRQLTLANERAAEEARLRAGSYVAADDAKLEMGRIAGRLVAAFEGVMPELAAAVAAQSTLSQRDALYLMRGAWRAARARLSGVETEAAIQARNAGGGRVTALANPRRLAHEALAAALRPPPPIDYLEWAEDNVAFGDSDPFPRPYNRAAFPYFDEILTALSPSDPCRFVTFVGSAQVGKTVLGNIFALGSVSMARGTTLVCHPTIDNALRWSKLKLAPMMRATPIVRTLFPERSRDTWTHCSSRSAPTVWRAC